MASVRQMRAAARALVGAVALYGLLLQAFVAAATPIVPPDVWAVLCAADGTARHGPDKPVRHDGECCVATHAGKLAPPPLPVAAAAPSPAASVPVANRPATSIEATGPPVHAHSARGPPLPV